MSGFWSWLRTALAYWLGARSGAAQERQEQELATAKESADVATAIAQASVAAPADRRDTLRRLRSGSF